MLTTADAARLANVSRKTGYREVGGEPASDLELAVIAAVYEHNRGKPWRRPEPAS